MMPSSESDGFDVTKDNAVALIGPIQIYSASYFLRHVHPAIETKKTRSYGADRPSSLDLQFDLLLAAEDYDSCT